MYRKFSKWPASLKDKAPSVRISIHTCRLGRQDRDGLAVTSVATAGDDSSPEENRAMRWKEQDPAMTFCGRTDLPTYKAIL